MHPTILQFQKFSLEKRNKIAQMCELYHLRTELEDSIILAKLEFQDDNNTEAELLILEIELYALYQKVGNLDKAIIQMQAEIENINMYMNHL